MPADVLDVLEPTLIDLFTREVSVMQRLVEIALLLINKTFDEKNLMNESVSVPSVAVHEHRREKSKLQGAWVDCSGGGCCVVYNAAFFSMETC